MTHIKRYIQPPYKNTWKNLHLMPDLSEIQGALGPGELVLKALKAPGSLTFGGPHPTSWQTSKCPYRSHYTYAFLIKISEKVLKEFIQSGVFLKNKLFSAFL